MFKGWLIVGVVCLTSFRSVAADTLRVGNIERVEIIGSQRAYDRARLSIRVDSAALSRGAGLTLGELLGGEVPVVVRSYGRGQRQSVSFRGTASTHTSLYWNSVKLNSPVVGDVDFSLLPTYAVDVLSVSPGVSAISFGDGALGGVVNVSGKADWSKRFACEALVEAGSFNSYNAMAAVRVGSDVLQSATKFIYNYSLNDFNFVNRDIIDPTRPGWHPTMRNENADYQNMGVTEDLFFRLKNEQSITFSLMLLDNWRNLPQLTTYEGPINANLTHSSEKSARAALTYKRFGKWLAIEALLGATIDDNVFLQRNLQGEQYVDYIHSKSIGRSLQGGVKLTFAHFENQTIATHTAFSLDDARSREQVKGIGFDKSRFTLSQSVSWFATWVEGLTSSLALRAGAVDDKFYGTGSATVDYSPSRTVMLSLRGGYNEHYASLSDMYSLPGGNASLRPEKGWSVEVGTTVKVEGLRLMANLYWSSINDWIVWLPTHAQYWTPTNLRQVQTMGAEIQASYNHRFNKDWSAELGGVMSLSRTINMGEPIGANDFAVGEQLPFVPLLSGSARAEGRWRNLTLIYSVEAEGAKSSATNADRQSSATISPYDIHSLSIQYRPLDFLVLRAECRNLFDAQFYGVMRRPMPPRSFWFSARFSL